MTQIAQQVTPRHRSAVARYRQRGSITSTTITALMGIGVITSVAMLSFFYLNQVQDTATQGVDIHQLEARLIELRERQRSLELESAELRSIQAIERHGSKLNLVPVDRVTYLAPLPGRLTARAE